MPPCIIETVERCRGRWCPFYLRPLRPFVKCRRDNAMFLSMHGRGQASLKRLALLSASEIEYHELILAAHPAEDGTRCFEIDLSFTASYCHARSAAWTLSWSYECDTKDAIRTAAQKFCCFELPFRAREASDKWDEAKSGRPPFHGKRRPQVFVMRQATIWEGAKPFQYCMLPSVLRREWRQ